MSYVTRRSPIGVTRIALWYGAPHYALCRYPRARVNNIIKLTQLSYNDLLDDARIYNNIVMGHLLLSHVNAFFDQYLDHIGKLLRPFTTRWPFFTATWRHVIEETESGFPPSNIFKTSFQVLYNSLKGGLDANTEQMV